MESTLMAIDWQLRRGIYGEWRWSLRVDKRFTALVQDANVPGITRYTAFAVCSEFLVRGAGEFEWLSDAKKAAVELAIDTIEASTPRKAE